MWLELYINLTLGLLQTKYLTNRDEWKEAYAEIEIQVFDIIYEYIFFPTVIANVRGLHPRIAGQLISLEQGQCLRIS
jgi:hypothetical protein